MNEQKNNQTKDHYDPVFVHSRREAIVIFCTWLAALAWAVPYCYFNGYHVAEPENIATVFGVPAWLFWGIVVPWLVADLFTIWFCWRFMKDDDLGAAGDEQDTPKQPAGEDLP